MFSQGLRVLSEDSARAAIIDACLRMNALGINQGKAGNVSLRWDRGGADGLLLTPSALAYDAMTVDDIVWISLQALPSGEAAVVDGLHPPSSEWRIHRDLYLSRADAAAVVHAHPVYATALACTADGQAVGIPAFHYMVAVAGGHDIRCARYATFGTQALSAHALVALQGRSACLLANHGLLALGASLEAALGLAVEVETLARMYAQVRQSGDPVLLDADEMQRVLRRFEGYGAR